MPARILYIITNTRTRTFLIVLILATAVPVLAEMNDYQRGVANGLKIGRFMGEYYGRGQYVTDYAGQYNAYLDSYN
ncbi:hypothetical protein [Methanothrix sp.]|uniref:hypothetical protein n=1 Tax=Methanothrix sp. TaxID=90426 RepID=UPI003298295C